MNDSYNHKDFCEEMARSLRLISHTDTHRAFLLVSGSEAYTLLDDILSSIDGPILIAIEQGEDKSVMNRADCLEERFPYSLLIAIPTDNDDTSTICAAERQSLECLRQVRNTLIARYGQRIDGYHIFPSGPIGDNFYGSVLQYSWLEYPDYSVDQAYFNGTEE